MSYDPLRRDIIIRTVIDGSLIEQSIDLAGQVTRRVFDTAEYQTREALIRLGWTPPASDPPPDPMAR